MSITRRCFLAGSAAVAAAGTVAGPAVARPSTQPGSPAPARIPTVREDHRAVIVGSGFGGGVSALRLAQAGVQVTLLERGIRWPTGPNARTFPEPGSNIADKRLLWFGTAPEALRTLLPTGFPRIGPVPPFPGLIDAVVGDTITALCGASYGGGSITYLGMSLQPSRAVFEEHFPSGIDYTRMDRVLYPRVAQMLQLQPPPDELIASPTYESARVFARNARRAGYQVDKVPVPVDWSYALAELRGEVRQSYTNNGSIGINNGGKHSVDVTYLAAAEATGRLDVRTLHEVTEVFETRDGRWEVHADHLDLAGRVIEKKILTTRALVMSAGSGNTPKILVRSAALGHIRDMPDALGTGWGTNGDLIYVWNDPAERFGAVQGGPVVYASEDWSNPTTANTVIQAGLPPLPADLRTAMMVGFGVSPDRGRFDYVGASDSVILRWPRDGDHAIREVMSRRAHRIAGPGSTLVDTNAIANTTWHGLGGACMGSVCDLDGRVLGKQGLYVVDGALIPGTTGACNPSITIAAIAERAMEAVVTHDVGTVI